MIATEALDDLPARVAGLTLVLFRDDRADDQDGIAAILREALEGSENRYPVIAVDIRTGAGVAALYHVRTTPTILLMKDGRVVDRVIGTPTRILLESLLDARVPASGTAGHGRATRM